METSSLGSRAIRIAVALAQTSLINLGLFASLPEIAAAQ